jgi:hypothetical protein
MLGMGMAHDDRTRGSRWTVEECPEALSIDGRDGDRRACGRGHSVVNHIAVAARMRRPVASDARMR